MTGTQEAGAGPSGAFTGWVSDLARIHTVPLARIGRAEGLRPDEALDAVQETLTTFLLLPQARKLVGHEEDSRAFLSVIIRNAARNLRRRSHRTTSHSAIPQGDDTLVDDAPTTDDLIAAAESHVRLQGCVSRLSEIQSEIVTLRMLQEVSNAEAAAALQLQPGNVAVLLHRAKKDLRDCMLE